MPVPWVVVWSCRISTLFDLLSGNGSYTPQELALLEEEFLPYVQVFATNNSEFLKIFAQAWNKLVTADRFDGPFANLCDGRADPTLISDFFDTSEDDKDEDSSDKRTADMI